MPIYGQENQENETSDAPSGFVLSEERDVENYYSHLQKKRQQNIALAILGVIGVAVIFLGFWQMRASINLPFPVTADSGKKVAVQTDNSTDLSQLDAATLKKQDTDGDGLSDYDEMYIYHTSPYLADSDSDGTSDFDEIKNGTDPNCPEGQTCFQTASTAGAVNPTADANNPNSLTFEQFRALLMTTGQYTQQQINALSDAELNQLYQEMQKANPKLAGDLQTNSDASATVIDANNVSIDQIKQMLRDQGMDDETLGKVDDATLMSLYQQALQTASNSTTQK
ncbi:MAG: hypothetical protein V1763_00850 [Parcubacteria group bacterium]